MLRLAKVDMLYAYTIGSCDAIATSIIGRSCVEISTYSIFDMYLTYTLVIHRSGDSTKMSN